MQPGKNIPPPNPAAKADVDKIAAALRQAPADYAAFKAKAAASGGKVPVESGVIKAASKVVPADQKSGVAALRAAKPDLQIRFDSQTGAAVSIKAANLHTAGRVQALSRVGAAGAAAVAKPPLADVVGAASQDGLDTLQVYQGLLKIGDARQEFVRTASDTDSLGLTHVKYQQVYKGLPVWNKQVWVHLDPQGASYLVEGRTEPTPTVTTEPRITAQQAIDRMAADLGEARDPATELVVHVDGWDIARLAWHVTAWRKGERWHFFVDAFYGVILQRTCDTRYEAATGSGVDLLGTTDTFSAWHQDSDYYLLDASMPIHVGDPLLPNELGTGNLVVFDGQHQNPDSNMTAYFFSSTSPTAGWDAAGVSVLDHFRTITEYYKNTHSRSGIDNHSLNAIAFAHVGTNWDNAAWTGQVIVLGDGQEFLSLARGLDVIAHEYTHGVIEYSANFEYQFQSGALHEALADVFGCMIDRKNWTMGEDIVRSGPPLRDLANPHAGLDSAPATMDEYQNLSINDDLGGVHVNATIPGHAAYMMAEGLSNGIGRDKVEQIFYRALTMHMTSQSNFADCRSATIQSAQELYGAGTPEVQAVTDAWDAVKVTAATSGGGGGGGGAQIPPIQGPDGLVFLTYDNLANPRLAFTSQGTAYYVSPVSVSLTRSVVIFGGSQVLYVDALNNLREASLSPSDNYDVPVPGGSNVRTICGSKDGRYLAFTDTSMDNRLHLVDLHDAAGDKTFDLYMPSTDGGQTTSLLDHADVIDFDISNTHVVFDALNRFSVSGTAQDYTFWNVGILDIGTGNVTSAVSAQPQGVQVGNPCASSTQDWIIGVDVVDDTAGTCQTRVVNLQTNKTGLVAEQNNTVDLGWPAFNGDDTSVALQYGGAIVSVPIAAQSDGTVDGDFSKAGTLEPDAYFPRYYRTGQIGGKPHITLSSASLDFGDMEVGSSAQLVVTVGNTGNYPLTISGIALSGSSQFSHDGAPIEIAAGYEMGLTVTFAPTAAGTASAVLTIDSDDPDAAQTTIQLAGNAIDSTPSGGGDVTSNPRCFIATAAYGSSLEPHVVALRTFRDRYLLTSAPGCAFVAAYYRCSPPIAAFIAGHEGLRTLTRGVLTPVVLAVQYPEPAMAVFFALVGGGLSWRRRRVARRRQSLM